MSLLRVRPSSGSQFKTKVLTVTYITWPPFFLRLYLLLLSPSLIPLQSLWSSFFSLSMLSMLLSRGLSPCSLCVERFFLHHLPPWPPSDLYSWHPHSVVLHNHPVQAHVCLCQGPTWGHGMLHLFRPLILLYKFTFRYSFLIGNCYSCVFFSLMFSYMLLMLSRKALIFVYVFCISTD